ncbi:MAG: hypothetical protein COS84_08780 [Armatimonadetes bacterium CG07_land_8_20_14_0_80_40_9]|nr:MAG: hypothetical protein COS84_08780 [Armatimonadetes bacterium CG07_land_8_20_14_0_80_40_9]
MGDRFDKWDNWLNSIFSEITNLSINRNIFWEVQDIIEKNPKIQKPSAFYEFLGSVYVASALMGIRRQVKIDKDSISFARLLKEICDTPEVFSRTRFVALYKGSTAEHLANRDFNKFAGETGSHVDPNLIRLDLEELKAKVRGCEKYADQRVAHFDKQVMSNIPTFSDLDDCIDFLEKLMEKYYLLFRAGTLESILPVYQYDWKAIFREPWLPQYKNHFT